MVCNPISEHVAWTPHQHASLVITARSQTGADSSCFEIIERTRYTVEPQSGATGQEYLRPGIRGDGMAAAMVLELRMIVWDVDASLLQCLKSKESRPSCCGGMQVH